MVKPGYKQTEIGVIPEDWETSSLSAAFQKLEAGVSVNSDNSLSSEYHILKTSAVHDGVVDTAETKPVIPQDYLRLKCPLVKGSIIISRMNTPALVGECGFTKDAKAGTYLPDRLWQIQNFNKSSFDFVWLNYLLNTKQYRDAVRATATGTSNSMKNISKERMLDIEIPRPPINEQENIAAALSEVDELINLVEKQVDKKKAIKQGAMQELLTGKKRLPGFSGDWIKSNIGSCIIEKPSYGINAPAVDFNGFLPRYIRITDISKDGRYCKDAQASVSAENVEPFLLKTNDIVLARTGASVGKSYIYDEHDGRLVYAGFLIKMSIDPQKADSRFVFGVLHTYDYWKWVAQTSMRSGQPGINGEEYASYEFRMPSDLKEQKAIADILSNMDNEIVTLGKKLIKYRQVKQGMMQQLLTGKIRLKNDVEDLRQAEQANAVKTLPARTAHNRQFDDAVSIAAIVDAFYSDKYPLGRVKVQKLLYLLHRHQAVSVSDFKKKAAGPYADTVRYKGGEPIAKKNKYIVSENGKQGTRYSRGENMAQALSYVERWGMKSDLQWLKENFLHTGRNDLELFATVDMAICDLNEAGVPISVASIKNLIASSKEWKAKLSKTYFSDRDIARAIKKCTELFN